MNCPFVAYLVLEGFPICFLVVLYLCFIFHLFVLWVFLDFFSISPMFIPHSFFFSLPSICSSFYSSFVFNLFFICFPSSLCLFFLCYFFYTYSSFLPHLFSICFFFPFIYHSLSICSSFHSHLFFSFAILSWSQIWFAVKAQYRFVAWSIFRSKFPRSERMDVKAKRKVFQERLCTSYLVPR